ncbi:hypothetical protein MUY27_00045 [Mucilaginibacter sp. RS28]|uniref:Uncharacterized protein n=1 Tax=Mucilaginibacter straminoryzae TaxID=2932774 RepID=A0A9X1WYW7_9SPHI|nr:hypothetical protein [Mucilaginibacter straminoryzae]MCJ8208074.1 hypothetical protein [Mucilaginibacter straminoryzae]
MNKPCLSFIAFLLFTKFTNGQVYDRHIFIGQQRDSVQALVAAEVQIHYGAGGYLTKVTASTEDYKGKAVAVILCKENVLIEGIEKGLQICTRYVIQNDTVAIIRTQFYNLSLQELIALLRPGRTNVSGYYFDPGYHIYHKIYIDAAGVTTDDQFATVWERLPIGVAENLRLLLKKW